MTPDTPNRWLESRSVSGEAYDATYERREAAGEHVHGEADLVELFAPAAVLAAGCGTGRVGCEIGRRGVGGVGVGGCLGRRVRDQSWTRIRSRGAGRAAPPRSASPEALRAASRNGIPASTKRRFSAGRNVGSLGGMTHAAPPGARWARPTPFWVTRRSSLPRTADWTRPAPSSTASDSVMKIPGAPCTDTFGAGRDRYAK